MDDDESFFFEMANQTADQAFLLLGLDRFSAENLINEIKTETNFRLKYSKLLHVLIDRLTVMNQSHLNFPEECKECIKKVRNIFRQIANNQKKSFSDSSYSDSDFVPSKPKDFLKWIPGQFELFTTKMANFRLRIDKSQKKLDHIMMLNTAKEGKNRNDRNDDVDKDSQNKLEIISVSNSKQFSEMKMVKSQLIMQMLR